MLRVWERFNDVVYFKTVLKRINNKAAEDKKNSLIGFRQVITEENLDAEKDNRDLESKLPQNLMAFI